MKMKPVRHLKVGYIHNPVTLFWVLRWRYNFTTSNASKILSSFHVPLQKLAMVLTWIKKKPSSHGNRKITMIDTSN